MVTITVVERLRAEMKIGSVNYDLKGGTATAIFVIEVVYIPVMVARRVLSVTINVGEEEIKKLESMLTQKRNILTETFEKVKNRIASLLAISSSVEVDLEAIADSLLEAVKDSW